MRKLIDMPMPYGSVLIVDDVEINLCVVEGMLAPYKLKVEMADSGFAALEKVAAAAAAGANYDIIFMDHMMPQMDGIETTEKLRAMGYKGAIIALTANARFGNDDLFARHGFDGFIPKPIDARQMNAVLNKFIRERRIEEAPQTAEASPDETRAKLLRVFRRDAQKAVATLRETAPRGKSASGNIKLLTTTAHAMKSALANIGEDEKSQMAAALEKAGHDGDMGYIAAHIESFIEALELLSITLNKITPNEAGAGGAEVAEDAAYLQDQLQIIETACTQYDDAAAYAALDRLKEKPWKSETAAALADLREMLFLHSDFDGAAARAKNFFAGREK